MVVLTLTLMPPPVVDDKTEEVDPWGFRVTKSKKKGKKEKAGVLADELSARPKLSSDSGPTKAGDDEWDIRSTWNSSTVRNRNKKSADESVATGLKSATKIPPAESPGELSDVLDTVRGNRSKEKAVRKDPVVTEHTNSTPTWHGYQRESLSGNRYTHPLYRPQNNGHAAPLYHTAPRWDPVSPHPGVMPIPYLPPALPPPYPPVASLGFNKIT
jgi:hypothetical protein